VNYKCYDKESKLLPILRERVPVAGSAFVNGELKTTFKQLY